MSKASTWVTSTPRPFGLLASQDNGRRAPDALAGGRVHRRAGTCWHLFDAGVVLTFEVILNGGHDESAPCYAPGD